MTDRQLVLELIKRINNNTNSNVLVDTLEAAKTENYIEIENSAFGEDIVFGFENEKITKIFC